MAHAVAEGAIHVGTSGWTYADWAGRFYPRGVSGAKRLAYYAEQFDTVEVNATFYRTPTAAMLAAWNRTLPPHFHLVLKGPRRITHFQRLRDCEALLDGFLRTVAPLHRLVAILWQLPPTLQRDLPLLEAFLRHLPPHMRHALEFRHASWWDDAVAELLARHGAAFVAISHPELPDALLPGADFVYLRFHGLGPGRYDYDYSRAELRRWTRRLAPLRRGRTLYAYFNNDHLARAPANALAFRSLLEAQRG